MFHQKLKYLHIYIHTDVHLHMCMSFVVGVVVRLAGMFIAHLVVGVFVFLLFGSLTLRTSNN